MSLIIDWFFASGRPDNKSLQADKREQQDTDEDLAPPGVKLAVECYECRNQRLKHDTKQGSEDITDTACQERAADNSSCYDIELHTLQVERPA